MPEPSASPESTGGRDEPSLSTLAPQGPCRQPPAPLRTRVGTSTVLRRWTPTSLAVARARLRGARTWERDRLERDRARAAMTAVIAGTPLAGESERLARAHVVAASIKESLFWQPWRSEPLAPEHLDRLQRALASGRGVLLSSSHCGPYNLGVNAVTDTGRRVFSATGWGLARPEPGYWGRRIAVRRTRASERGELLVAARGSFDLLADLLRWGEVVGVFFTMPGGRETMFLGKPVMLASGTVRLAIAADALVLPVAVRLQGHRAHLELSEPLDVRDRGEQLHEDLAAIHERWLLQAPEMMEDPNRTGAWEGSAGPARWEQPPSRAAASSADLPGSGGTPS